ncbi:unnamed protein product [Tuber melanosporum]|uniref:(Perigord truffle) hypothetical protein n=1 Tax=Tuber melanosporum (strain Mel28) TaxID=656061 RepID=D5GD14_TUBMM|nr:uncharacterized protein GSTUM_00000931001 [Tuber melanosporum]CAZ82407.1 unnamed protein product [Tuber melanosporum]
MFPSCFFSLGAVPFSLFFSWLKRTLSPNTQPLPCYWEFRQKNRAGDQNTLYYDNSHKPDDNDCFLVHLLFPFSPISSHCVRIMVFGKFYTTNLFATGNRP